MKNKFAETIALLNLVLSNNWFGMIIHIDPYAIGTSNEGKPIQYMVENRCNYYNRSLGYPSWQIKNALERIKDLAQNAFADGKWLDACALQIAYVAELDAFFVLDGNSRLAAILYINQMRIENGLDPLFNTIPAQVTFYHTYAEAQRAMDLLNDACVSSKNTKKAYDVQEKRRMFAINKGGNHALLYGEFVELQETFPSYVSDRTAEIIVYGDSKTAQFDNDVRSPFCHISKTLLTNVFPQTLPLSVLSTLNGKNKKDIENAYSSFTTPKVLGELARYIYYILPSISEESLIRLANRIKELLFADNHFSASLMVETLVKNRNRVARRDALIDVLCKDKVCVSVLGKRFRSKYQKLTKKQK